MDIDLLFTEQGAAGLVASSNFIRKVAGVLFNPYDGHLTLEYKDMEALDLNIPVEEHYHGFLDFNTKLHIGAVSNNQISQAYQVPLLFTNDPYRNEDKDIEESKVPLSIFKLYLHSCVSGQAVHRENLNEQGEHPCVLGDNKTEDFIFAKHLARQYVKEVMPRATPVNALNYGLKYGLSGPKLN